MADITLAYQYPAGTFSPSGHSQNVYDATDGVSLMGEANGRIQTANMLSGFVIRAEHILPGQCKEVFFESNLRAQPLVDNMLSTDSDTAVGYVAIPGVSVKRYFPFTRPVVEFAWQAYMHPFKFVGVLPGPVYTVKRANLITYFDGAQLLHTKCQVPVTTVYDSQAGGFVSVMYSNEGSAAYAIAQSHLETNVTAGYHTIELRLWMELSRTDSANYKLARGSNPPASSSTAWGTGGIGGYSSNWMAGVPLLLGTGYEHDVFNRVTFGIRNMIVSGY